MTTYYIERSEIINFLNKLSKAQTNANRFINVTVKPYKGKKYDKSTTLVVVVG